MRSDWQKAPYAAALLRKYGPDVIEELDKASREVVRWDRKWLEGKIKEYTEKLAQTRQ